MKLKIVVPERFRFENFWEGGKARKCICGEVLLTKKEHGIHRRTVHHIGRLKHDPRNVSEKKLARHIKMAAQKELRDVAS